MYTLTNAQIYSTKGELAYQQTFTNPTQPDHNVRAVESKGNIIRKECLNNGTWELIGKPYIVTKNKKRNAERIKEEVRKFLNA